MTRLKPQNITRARINNNIIISYIIRVNAVVLSATVSTVSSYSIRLFFQNSYDNIMIEIP